MLLQTLAPSPGRLHRLSSAAALRIAGVYAAHGLLTIHPEPVSKGRDDAGNQVVWVRLTTEGWRMVRSAARPEAHHSASQSFERLR